MAHPHDPVLRGIRAVIRALKRPDVNRFTMLLDACLSRRPDYMAMVWHICADPRTQVGCQYGCEWMDTVRRVAELERINVLRCLHARFGINRNILTAAINLTMETGNMEALHVFQGEICLNRIFDLACSNYYSIPSRRGINFRIMNELIGKISLNCECAIYEYASEWRHTFSLVCQEKMWLLPQLVANRRPVCRSFVPAVHKLSELLGCPLAQAPRTDRSLGILLAIRLTQTKYPWFKDCNDRIGIAWLSAVWYLLDCANNPLLPKLPNEIWEQIAFALQYRCHHLY